MNGRLPPDHTDYARERQEDLEADMERIIAMEEERIVRQIEDQQAILEDRQELLARVRDEMVHVEGKRARLETRAEVLEQGIASIEGAIEDLWAKVRPGAPDMTATGETDDTFADSDEDWEAHGFTLAED